MSDDEADLAAALSWLKPGEQGYQAPAAPAQKQASVGAVLIHMNGDGNRTRSRTPCTNGSWPRWSAT